VCCLAMAAKASASRMIHISTTEARTLEEGRGNSDRKVMDQLPTVREGSTCGALPG
jgi:hypothetical protein